MTEKIEWYKEVLELEPNSKVFLPLARLYLQIGQTEEAIAVLEHGLTRHPEHLEARLLLVELLHRTGQQEECSRQVSELSRLFSTYAHFWQAWAVCLGTSGESPEISTALRLLAANFLHGPLSVQTLLDKGLDTVLGEQGRGAVVSTASPAETSVPESSRAGEAVQASSRSAAAFVSSAPATSLLDEVAGVSDGSGAMPSEPPLAPSSSVSPSSSGKAPAARPADSSVAPPHSLLAAVMEEVDDSLDDDVLSAYMPLPREMGLTEDDDVEADAPVQFVQSLSEEAEENSPHPVEGAVFSPSPRGPLVVAAHDVDDMDEADGERDDTKSALPDDGDEVFSLRTRSMADILAEQGDLRGALDIYHELLTASTGADERLGLQQRIDALTARLEGQPDQEENGSVAEVSGKEKLITVLEALAERVEARAQN